MVTFSLHDILCPTSTRKTILFGGQFNQLIERVQKKQPCSIVIEKRRNSVRKDFYVMLPNGEQYALEILKGLLLKMLGSTIPAPYLPMLTIEIQLVWSREDACLPIPSYLSVSPAYHLNPIHLQAMYEKIGSAIAKKQPVSFFLDIDDTMWISLDKMLNPELIQFVDQLSSRFPNHFSTFQFNILTSRVHDDKVTADDLEIYPDCLTLPILQLFEEALSKKDIRWTVQNVHALGTYDAQGFRRCPLFKAAYLESLYKENQGTLHILVDDAAIHYEQVSGLNNPDLFAVQVHTEVLYWEKQPVPQPSLLQGSLFAEADKKPSTTTGLVAKP